MREIDRQPMLVRADLDWPVPEGWRAEDAGTWMGRPTVALYDPRRHDVLIARGDVSEPEWAAFREAGFELQGVDGSDEFWVRDRLSVTRERLARLDARCAEEVDLAPEARGL